MSETKYKNPIKQLAVLLAHQMDEEKDMYEDYKPDWKIEEIRETGRHLRNEIFKKGYSIDLILAYMEEYKTLSIVEYREWVYR